MQIRGRHPTGDDTAPVAVASVADPARRIFGIRPGSVRSRMRRSVVAALVAVLAVVGAVGAVTLASPSRDASDDGAEPITVETPTPTAAPPSTTTPSSIEPPSTSVGDGNGTIAPVGDNSERGNSRDDEKGVRKAEKGEKGERPGRSGNDD